MNKAHTGTAPRLYQRACEVLIADLTAGILVSGARLTETAIADRFGISRAPARQALESLRRDGMLLKVDGRGYVIAENAAQMAAPRSVTPMLVDPKIHALSTWERIYAEIENEIVSRTTFGSWRINEAMLARQYDVSRTVARDVVARLQQRGIVQKDDSSRWFAPALNAKHMNDLFELRWVLEPAALEKAFPVLPDGFLTRLRQNLESAMSQTAAMDGETLDGLEQELHVELLGYCDNRALMRAISLPQSLLIAHHFLYRWTTELFGTEPFLAEHLDIVQRLEGGDMIGAKAAWIQHLQVSRERAMLRIQAVTHLISPEELAYLERID